MPPMHNPGMTAGPGRMSGLQQAGADPVTNSELDARIYEYLCKCQRWDSARAFYNEARGFNVESDYLKQSPGGRRNGSIPIPDSTPGRPNDLPAPFPYGEKESNLATWFGLFVDIMHTRNRPNQAGATADYLHIERSRRDRDDRIKQEQLQNANAMRLTGQPNNMQGMGMRPNAGRPLGQVALQNQMRMNPQTHAQQQMMHLQQQQHRLAQQQQAVRDRVDGTVNGQNRTQSPAPGDTASPSKRPRLNENMASQVRMNQVNASRQMMQNQTGATAAHGSPMPQHQLPSGAHINGVNQAMTEDSDDKGNGALQDYQNQLYLLEKKTQVSKTSQYDDSGQPNHLGLSPPDDGSKNGSPSLSDHQMRRGTPRNGQGMGDSPMDSGGINSMQRSSPNNPAAFVNGQQELTNQSMNRGYVQQMRRLEDGAGIPVQNGIMMAGATGFPAGVNGQLMAQQQQYGSAGIPMQRQMQPGRGQPNWPQAHPGMAQQHMQGQAGMGNPQGFVGGPQAMHSQQMAINQQRGNMAPPAPPGASATAAAAKDTESQQPPTPGPTSKTGKAKGGKEPKKKAKKSVGATPSADAELQTPSTPITPQHAQSFNKGAPGGSNSKTGNQAVATTGGPLANGIGSRAPSQPPQAANAAAQGLQASGPGPQGQSAAGQPQPGPQPGAAQGVAPPHQQARQMGTQGGIQQSDGIDMNAIGDMDFNMDGTDFSGFDFPNFPVNPNDNLDYESFLTEPGVDPLGGDFPFDIGLMQEIGSEIPGLPGDEGGGGNGA